MTFKHGKFHDSITMRSLERVARENGLIKDEPNLIKTASTEKKENYTPSGNLMENIINLCTGLRNLGFDKFANELESKFMTYKVANDLYQTSKETGEDLIQQAHPKGSHRISGVEGDAVVETILDEHIKLLNIVNKKPTGKLANHQNILKSVKKALAQSSNIPDLIKSLQRNAKGVLDAYNSVSALTRVGTDLPEKLVTEANTLNVTSLDFDILNSLYSKVQGIRSALKPGVLNTINNILNLGITNADWIQIETKLNSVQNAIHKLQEELKNPAKPITTTDPAIVAFESELKSNLNKLALWASKIKTDPTNKPQDIAQGMNWIVKKQSQLENIKGEFDKASPENKVEMSRIQLNNLRKIISEFDEFKNEWIGV